MFIKWKFIPNAQEKWKWFIFYTIGSRKLAVRYFISLSIERYRMSHCTQKILSSTRVQNKPTDQVLHIHSLPYMDFAISQPNNIFNKIKGHIFCVFFQSFSFVVEVQCIVRLCFGWKTLKCGADISKWERHDGLMAKTLWVVKSGSLLFTKYVMGVVLRSADCTLYLWLSFTTSESFASFK